MQFGSFGSMHCESFTSASSRYQSGNPLSGSTVLETAAIPPVPVPRRSTRCGEPLTLAEMASVTGCGPATSGMNCTPISHDWPGSTKRPEQVSVATRYWLVSAGSPVRTALVTPSGAVPVLDTVSGLIGLTVRTRTLPRSTGDAGVTAMVGASPVLMPLPVTATVSGEREPPVEATTRLAERRPATVGVKVRPTWQLWSRDSVTPTQPVFLENSAPLGPVIAVDW